VISPAFAQTWTPTSAPLLRWFGIACSADGNQLVAGAYTNGIYLSTNAGVDWKKTSAPAEAWFGMASSADGQKLVAMAYLFKHSTEDPLGGPIYHSTDGGNSWTKTSAPGLKWYYVVSSASNDPWLTNWTDMTFPPTLNLTNLHYEVAVFPFVQNLFFRLKQ
jgi:hypothetical protein